VEEGKVKVSRRKAYYARKIKKATQLLYYRRHKKPGAKGWELRKALGSDYPKVLKILNNYLKALDLQVKSVFEEPVEKPTPKQLDKARFYVTLRGEITPKETRMIGWRIDDLAGLAITIIYITSKNGKASRKEVEDLLREKLPGWKIDFNINRYIKYGYLDQDENEQLFLDWRTRAEVDLKVLTDLLLATNVA
jgi:hypothetical protein